MAGAMSAPEPVAAQAPATSASVRRPYRTITIVGGGCYGSYYVRQLGRAWSAGALSWERLVVVDRDPDCLAARGGGDWGGLPAGAPPMEIVVADWHAHFDRELGLAADANAPVDGDAIVPSPLMPHLVFDWLLSRARLRWPGRRVERRPLDHAPSVPWQRAGEDGNHYVSFAEWMCPINCIEPPTCPEIAGPRTWRMPAAVAAYAEAERGRGQPIAGPVVLHCAHRSHGVGMFDVREVVAGDRLVRDAAWKGPARVLVATVSNCHGALGLLAVE